MFSFIFDENFCQMNRISFLVLFLLMFTINYAQEKEHSTETVTTYYLIRHAEKDISNPTDKNPNLSSIGVQRAESWTKILKNASFDAVYSTDYNRTKQTAKPISETNNLETINYDLNTFDFEKFKSETKGKTIIIVGHSNTTPLFVNAFIGSQKYQQIKESNYSNLYIITIIGDTISDKLLTIN